MVIIAAFIILEIVRHWYIISVEKLEPDHRRAATLRGFFGIGLSVILAAGDPIKFLQLGTFTLFTFWFCFDYGLNIARGKPLTYLGEASMLDRFQRNTFGLGPWFWFKLVLMLASIKLNLVPISCLWQYQEGC